VDEIAHRQGLGFSRCAGFRAVCCVFHQHQGLMQRLQQLFELLRWANELRAGTGRCRAFDVAHRPCGAVQASPAGAAGRRVRIGWRWLRRGGNLANGDDGDGRIHTRECAAPRPWLALGAGQSRVFTQVLPLMSSAALFAALCTAQASAAASATPARRERLLDGWAGTDAAWAARTAQLLLAQDGSATLLCETVAGGPVSLVLHEQRELAAAQAPALVRQLLPGQHFIQRRVSLEAHGQVMMDNLSWLAPQALPADIRAELAQGRSPIGHLLARMWIRRVSLPAAQALWPLLWAQTGLPDPAATRSYAIHTPEGGAAMCITECFRRGMLMTLPPQY